MRIVYDITNGSSKEQNVNMIAALYKRDFFQKVIAKPVNVPSQQTKSDSIELKLPETDLEQYKVRMMVWDSWPGMSPLGSVKTEKLVSEER